MSWLAYGPFYEVSFVIRSHTSPGETARYVLSELKEMSPLIAFAETDKLIEEHTEKYEEGHLFDPTDAGSKRIRDMTANLWVEVSGRRRCRLFLEEVSTTLTHVCLCFYAGHDDANVEGLPAFGNSDIPAFERFLITLFRRFDFPLGTMGTESDVLGAFRHEGEWPDERYNLDELDDMMIDEITEGWTAYTHALYNKKVFMVVEYDPALVVEADQYYLVKSPKL
jgi:hypothetical protein